jgi:prepilin-type N-terminal cleavage/methylation domain-containing protein
MLIGLGLGHGTHLASCGERREDAVGIFRNGRRTGRVGGSGIRGEAGFSLLEVLIVVAIFGMISLVMTIAVSKTLKRQRLETAAHEIQSFVERAYTNSTTHGRSIFVQVQDPAADGSRWMRMYDDGTGAIPGDGYFDPANDPLIDSQIITSEIPVVTTATVTTWPKPAGQSYYLLQCNTLGQAMTAPLVGTSGIAQRLTGPVALALTHKEMLPDGLDPPKLKPIIRFDVTVNVLWRPNLIKWVNGKKVSS